MHGAMRRPTLLGMAAVAMLLAGCGDRGLSVKLSDEPGADMTRSAGEYWMAWIEGEEGPEDSRYACSIVFDHQVDAEARSIRYSASTYRWAPATVDVLIVYDIWERGSDCPEAYAIHKDARAYAETKRWGNADASVGSDGSVTFAGTAVQPGELGTFKAERGGAESVIRVHAFGAWPRSGLQPDS